MRSVIYGICVFVGSAGFTAVVSSDAATDEEQIRHARATSNEAIRNHDAAAIVAMFADPYQITTGSGMLFHDSPAQEKKLWEKIFADNPDVLYVRTPNKVEISSYLPRAAESGDWVGTWTTAKGPIEVGGRYSASWIKVSGSWKLQSEMFVSMYCSGEAC